MWEVPFLYASPELATKQFISERWSDGNGNGNGNGVLSGIQKTHQIELGNKV